MSQFRTWYDTQPTALRALLTINVVLYVLWTLVLGRLGLTAEVFYQHLALNPSLPGLLFEPWQLVTYNFLHLGGGLGGFLHVLFNMLWMYWIGKEYEEMHGAHYLLALYLLAGVGGGLLSVVVYNIFGWDATIYGASASVIGILMAVAIQYPYKKIALLFLGTIRLLYVVLGFLALDLLFMMGSGVAVAAHLGGALSGFLFAKAVQGGADPAGWARIFFRGGRGGRSATRSTRSSSAGGGGGSWFGGRSREAASSNGGPEGRTLREERAARNAARNAEEAEIDRILDKINEEGYEALSEEEKRRLDEASRR